MPTDDEIEDIGDTGIMGYAMTQLRNSALFGQLTQEQQDWLVDQVAVAMEFMADETGQNYPHHGAAAMVAQLHKAELLTEQALGLACVFTAAIEQWERDRAGA